MYQTLYSIKNSNIDISFSGEILAQCESEATNFRRHHIWLEKFIMNCDHHVVELFIESYTANNPQTMNTHIRKHYKAGLFCPHEQCVVVTNRVDIMIQHGLNFHDTLV